MKGLSATFLKGLAAVLPIAITLYLIIWIGTMAESVLCSMLRWLLPPNWHAPGMGLVAGVVFVLVMGLLLNQYVVQRYWQVIENRFFQRIPLIKTVYGAVQDLMSLFANQKGDALHQVVQITLGETNFRLIGFVTREDFTELPSGLGNEETIAVYLPMSYQIGGYTVLLPRSAVQPIDMSIEDAMRFAVTAGMSSSRKNGMEVPPLTPGKPGAGTV